MELAAFEGDWRISRRIEDRRNGLSGRFEGRACFTPEAGGGLRYEETGTLRLGAGPPMAAARRYLWRETLGMIEVWFDDGRFFHAFDPARPDPAAHHDCPPDSYDVRYDFAAAPRAWASRWQVAGPRKAHLIESHYTRSE
ncbi:DUF6314 family protein [Rhodobacteraceae bacterium DSL-40]|uniref:DUF6314 family protein n=1 Tax=Amaricoccus sp. B4 TaxID=3368557 RepID=UPI000DAEB772